MVGKTERGDERMGEAIRTQVFKVAFGIGSNNSDCASLEASNILHVIYGLTNNTDNTATSTGLVQTVLVKA